jgi:hypothetical protein
VVDAGSSIRLLGLPHLLVVVVVAEVVVVAHRHVVGSRHEWPWPIHRVGVGGSGWLLGIWAVGNEVSSLVAVETHPGVVVVVVGGDLAGFALWGLHGVMVVVGLELGSGTLRARGLRLGAVLHGGLESGHRVSEVSLALGLFLLFGLVLHELALALLLLFCPRSLCEYRHVHEGVEILVDLRGKQGPQFRSQSLLEHLLFLGVLVHFFWGITSRLYELVSVLLHGHVALAEFTKLICLSLLCGFWDVVAAKLFHELILGDGGGILGCCTVVLPPG